MIIAGWNIPENEMKKKNSCWKCNFEYKMFILIRPQIKKLFSDSNVWNKICWSFVSWKSYYAWFSAFCICVMLFSPNTSTEWDYWLRGSYYHNILVYPSDFSVAMQTFFQFVDDLWLKILILNELWGQTNRLKK